MNANPSIETLLEDAHEGAGGPETAPESALTPAQATYTPDTPIDAIVRSNRVLSSQSSGTEVRKIILEFKDSDFSVLEGQSIGVIAPGTDANGGPHAPRLYSISSPSDGEHSGNRTVTLTVQRVPGGICSEFLCDLEKGASLRVTGPYGDTFLMPTDPDARLLMICAGTGSAPMRAFTMARERRVGKKSGGMVLFFDGRRPDSFPYFGPLMRLPSSLLEKHLVFSQLPDGESESLEERMRVEEDMIAELLQDPKTHVYISGPKEIEDGIERAFTNIVESTGQQWRNLRNILRDSGRYHVETYWMSDAPQPEKDTVFEHEIRVTWGDCDPAKIVYTGRVPSMALEAINAWWEQATGDGWYQMELDRNIGTPFVSMKIDFRNPITPRHPLKCKVWPTGLGRTSVTFRVEGLQNGKLCFEGNFVSVFTIADAFEKTSPPENLRKVVQAHMVAEPA